MTQQARKAAESLAKATTRRGFLGRLVRAAGAAASGVAAILATGSAFGAPSEKRECYYMCPPYGVIISKWVPAHKPCPEKWGSCYSWNTGNF